MKTYSRDEVYSTSLEYFKGDELAANSFFKYALRNKKGEFHEKSPAQMHVRLAKEFARIEKKFGGNALGENEILKLFASFKYIVPQGSPMFGIGNNFVNMSLSNCVVVASPDDTMSSIMESAKELANLYKRRCGVGVDISNLRPDGSPVNNSAISSTGAWSFADLYSYVTRMVGQSGRRGALMITLDVRHPDVEKFITMKHDLTKVTGANVSVRFTDDFMNAVESNEDFQLRWPLEGDPKVTRVVKARDIWNLIVSSATKTAEPGLMMWDNIINTLPAHCYPNFETVTTNPCGEIPLSAYDSCRLISQNLKHYVDQPFTEEASFDFELLEAHTRIAMRLSDDLVELELEKLRELVRVSDTQDEKLLFANLVGACEEGRRTGLGTHGLADALARLCLPYDSSEAVEFVEKLYELRKNAAYRESVELAKERGSFSCWSWDLEKENVFIQGLQEDVLEDLKKHGRRNISLLTNAPTGTVSIMSQTSSGLEPVFQNSYVRRKKINHGDETAQVDFVDDNGDKWQEFKVYHHNVLDFYQETGSNGSSASLPKYFVESGDIDGLKRIEIQAAIQRHVDHSISSTINLPKGTTPKLVGELYLEGWKKGLKGLTVYVDGSRTGVLVSETEEKKGFSSHDAPKRPEQLECDIHHVSVKGERWVIFVGMMDERPYEVFGGLSDNIEIPSEYKKGRVIKGASFKHAPSRYDLKVNGFTIKNITKQFDNPTYQVHTRMVSLALRHGAKPSFLVEQLLKDPDNDLTSFSKVLSRVLKKYIIDGTKVTSEKVCPECGSENLIYQEGCVTCADCGHAKCG